MTLIKKYFIAEIANHHLSLQQIIIFFLVTGGGVLTFNLFKKKKNPSIFEAH